jgi:signal transduction histidine kinase
MLPGATREVSDVADALAMFDARHRDHFRQQTAMLASVAHDLGTPLARLAFRAESLPEAQREAAMADIEQMRRLITNGIALARGEVAVSEPIDLCALVRRVASDAGLDERRITVPDAALMVEGEVVAIERLVQNLVENGERHGGGAHLALRRAGTWACLTVEDEGPGFHPQILAIVCDPFVRGTDGTEGSGLGLAIARTVAERHGGSLAVGNRPQGGARVEALFPLST